MRPRALAGPASAPLRQSQPGWLGAAPRFGRRGLVTALPGRSGRAVRVRAATGPEGDAVKSRVSKIEEEIIRQRELIAAQRASIASQRKALESQSAELVGQVVNTGAPPSPLIRALRSTSFPPEPPQFGLLQAPRSHPATPAWLPPIDPRPLPLRAANAEMFGSSSSSAFGAPAPPLHFAVSPPRRPPLGCRNSEPPPPPRCSLRRRVVVLLLRVLLLLQLLHAGGGAPDDAVARGRQP